MMLLKQAAALRWLHAGILVFQRYVHRQLLFRVVERIFSHWDGHYLIDKLLLDVTESQFVVLDLGWLELVLWLRLGVNFFHFWWFRETLLEGNLLHVLI